MSFKNRQHTAETKQKLSAARKAYIAEHPEAIDSFLEAQRERVLLHRECLQYGSTEDLAHYRHSAETKQKIAAVLSGRRPSPQCFAAKKAAEKDNRENKELVNYLKQEHCWK